MRTEKVNFYSEGIKLAGVLYLPDSDQAKPYPAIVQGPGFLGLKDAKHYIMMFEKLCAAGYACLCFDYRGWGDSEGEQRGWVMPKWQAEDIRSALSYLETRADIDPDRLATYGSGGTGGGSPRRHGRIRSGDTGRLRGADGSEAEVEEFRARALALARAHQHELDLPAETVAAAAEHYAAGKQSRSFGSVAMLRSLFEEQGFALQVFDGGDEAERRRDRPSGPTRGWRSERYRIVAVRP